MNEMLAVVPKQAVAVFAQTRARTRHCRRAGESQGRSTIHLHGVAVGPCAQFNDRARMRADDVFPQPRGPENR